MQFSGFQIFQIKSTASTQEEVKKHIRLASHDLFPLVIADEQTRGRGQSGNTWRSEAGNNLTFSFVCFPDFLHAGHQFALSKAVALASVDFLQTILPDQEVSIKWPNDIYVGHKKIAGMLIENNVQDEFIKYSVVGIGLNVNQTIFSDDLPNAVSLSIINGKSYSLIQCLKELCRCIRLRYVQLKADDVVLHEDYLANLYRFGQLAPYVYQEKKVTALIRGVNIYGHLELETKEGQCFECEMKEIIFLP